MKRAWLALTLFALTGVQACGHSHDDDKVWSEAELAELNAKWGSEVRELTSLQCTRNSWLTTCSGHLAA
jgi:hypothetical protein